MPGFFVFAKVPGFLVYVVYFFTTFVQSHRMGYYEFFIGLQIE